MKSRRAAAPAIGRRIQATRKKLHLSLEELAARSGVSKSLLSQIERDKTNPTFATLWNLTRALDLEFSDLIGKSANAGGAMIETLTASLVPEIRTDDGLCLLRILGPAGSVGSMEWYDLVIAPHGALVSRPHAKGTTEHLTIWEGAVRISSGDEEQVLTAGMTCRYAADIAHTIRNDGRKPARALLVVLNDRDKR